MVKEFNDEEKVGIALKAIGANEFTKTINYQLRNNPDIDPAFLDILKRSDFFKTLFIEGYIAGFSLGLNVGTGKTKLGI